MLHIENISKHFGGVKAVDSCTFNVKEKTITALIGPNGAGKSTLFNIISGIIKADAGKIVLNNQEITNLSPEKISNLGISRLFQQSRLFPYLTVKENLLLSLDNEDTKFWKNLLGYRITKEKEEKIKNILQIIKLENFENTLTRELSYGQKRLVELARAILNPHSLLMLDEPVAGVNPFLRKEISSLLLSLKKQGETILLIEHDMNFTLAIANEVIVMDEGKVIASGNPIKIKNNPQVLEAYLGE